MRENLRILVLVHRFADNSPYSFYVHEQAKALRALGHDVRVIAPVAVLPGQRWMRPAAWQVGRDTPKQAVVEGIPIYYPRFPALGNAGERLLGGRHVAWAAWPVARRLHAEQPFDLVHAHLLTMDGHAGLLLGQRLGIPVALTAHGTDVFRYFTGPPTKRNQDIVARADAVMAVSERLKEILLPYRPQGIDVVRNGVDTAQIPKGTGAGFGRLLTGGTLKARKCMHTTLDAFLSIAAEFPEATLTIFGEGPDRESLQQKIDVHDMGRRVQLTGNLPHPEVLRRMSESDAFLMPSYAEGFGVVYIEAMAGGCIAVGSLGEGIADTVADGENGFLVPAADAEALAAVTRRILRGGAEIDAIRQRGETTARAMTWAKNAEQATAVYRRMLQSDGEASHAEA